MPQLTSLLVFFFVLFTFYEIEGWEMCTVYTRISRRNYYGRITYTNERILRNCTDGCCLSACCMSNTWTNIGIFLVVVGSLGFIGCVGAAIYYWKCRKPSPQYTIQPARGPMQNQGVMYSPSPMYSNQPVGQPGYNPYLSQIQPGSNPYGYSAPQSGTYPPSSPQYNPPMPQPPSQQQPGAYPPMPQPQQFQQSGGYPTPYPPPPQYIEPQSPNQPRRF